MAIPQILDKYGPDEVIEVVVNFTDVEPKFTFTENQWKMDLSVIISLLVKNENTLVARFEDFTLGGNFWTKDFKIYAKLDDPTVTKVSVVETTLEGFTEELLTEELKVCLYSLIEDANKVLAAGMTLPHTAKTDFNDNEVSIHEGYMQFEIDMRRIDGKMQKQEIHLVERV